MTWMSFLFPRLVLHLVKQFLGSHKIFIFPASTLRDLLSIYSRQKGSEGEKTNKEEKKKKGGTPDEGPWQSSIKDACSTDRTKRPPRYAADAKHYPKRGLVVPWCGHQSSDTSSHGSNPSKTLTETPLAERYHHPFCQSYREQQVRRRNNIWNPKLICVELQ